MVLPQLGGKLSKDSWLHVDAFSKGHPETWWLREVLLGHKGSQWKLCWPVKQQLSKKGPTDLPYQNRQESLLKMQILPLHYHHQHQHLQNQNLPRCWGMTGKSPTDSCTTFWAPGTCSPWGSHDGPEGGILAWSLQDHWGMPSRWVISRLCQLPSPLNTEVLIGALVLFSFSAPGQAPREPECLKSPGEHGFQLPWRWPWSPCYLFGIWIRSCLKYLERHCMRCFWLEKFIERHGNQGCLVSRILNLWPPWHPLGLISLKKNAGTLFLC